MAGLRRILAVLRRLLPDLGDLCALAGLALIVHVLYTLSFQLAEGFCGLVLLLIAAARFGLLSRRKGDE